MDIKLSIDFGQDYRVSLTATDARELYNQLHAMFGPQPQTTPNYSITSGTWPSDFKVSSSSMGTSITLTTPEVRSFLTEESTGTLREKDHYEDHLIGNCPSSCYRIKGNNS